MFNGALTKVRVGDGPRAAADDAGTRLGQVAVVEVRSARANVEGA